ncbi:MAG TPA: PKD domain-containing protein [Polyangiaceae bacterium]|nr:PKD domain-containing protein [Polyangiaceae bacterium]
MNKANWLGSLVVVGVLHLGCSDEGLGASEAEHSGTLQAALSGIGPTRQEGATDVARIKYAVVRQGQSCTDPPLATTTIGLEEEPLPQSLSPDGGGANHSFSDALMVLPPGQYKVCATPLTAQGVPSQQCAATSTPAIVVEGATTEVVMVSQCKGVTGGAIDAITKLNRPPVIDDLIVDPSKFITLCDVAQLTVKATDPDGDALTFLWQLLGTGMSSVNQTIRFRSLDVGTFQLRITVTDAFGAKTSLTLPMHISRCTDAGPG